jgi:class 3 adenylate cyclase/tetratricopeptide (TPR) repeat protein
VVTQDIGDWLEALGLGRYAEVFAENEIDLSVLPHITEDDLKEIGIALGARRKILVAASLDDPLVTIPTGTKPHLPFEPGDTASSPEAERRQLTVMFCDLVGSTELSTRLDPEDFREIMRAYQNACAGMITRFGGYVALFMGDGVLAYFGWPRGHENDVERAISAGLGIIGSVEGIRKPVDHQEPLTVRVGIATGPVVVGDIIGDGAAPEAAVTGETPNLAARLQAVAQPNTVVISSTTHDLAGGLFTYEALGEQSLKGLAHPVVVYAVKGEKNLESRFEARNAEIMPMVGRDQELALLMERWTLAKNGEGQGVLLLGEAGIGKSRIVHGLLDALAGQSYTRIHYQCSPLHTDSALWPVIQQIILAAGIDAADGTDARLEKLEALLARAQGPDCDVSLMADLIGLDGAKRYPPQDLPQAIRRARTLETLVGQLIGLAAQRPVLVVLEDAHWIDPTMLELIERCLDTAANMRMLTLMTSRPDSQPEIAAHPHVTRLTLNRLGRAGVETIVARLGGETLHRETMDAIIQRTDGVPLFVEELTKAVLETGEATIPVSLHDSLMSRLDRIPEVKEVAQIAACIGREFDFALLAKIVDLPKSDLVVALDRLSAAELVFCRGTPSLRRYLFKHALVRDAAYESLLHRRRRQIHERLVNVLENWDGVAPEILAHHAETAGLDDKAARLWHRAGTQAIARPAYKEAIANLNAAVRLCRQFDADPAWRQRELQIQVELGQALIANLGYAAPETIAAFEQGLVLAEHIDDTGLLMQSIYGLWASRYVAGLPTLNLAERFADTVVGIDDDGAECVSARMLALERYHEGQFRSSQELVDRALELYDADRHKDLALLYGIDPRAAALNYKAWNQWHMGRPDRARDTAERSLSWAREIGHPNTIGIAHCFGVGLTNVLLGHVERVEENARDVLRLAEEKALALWGAWGQIGLGWAMAEQGVPDGLAELERGLAAARRIGANLLDSFHLGLAANIQSRLGRHDDAKRTFSEAFSALAEGHDKSFAADLHRLRASGRRRASTNGTADAVRDLQRAMEIAREQGSLSLQLRAANDLALLWAEMGERHKAYDLLAPVRERFDDGVAAPDIARADVFLDELR